jgi:hypothetical protein
MCGSGMWWLGDGSLFTFAHLLEQRPAPATLRLDDLHVASPDLPFHLLPVPNRGITYLWLKIDFTKSSRLP